MARLEAARLGWAFRCPFEILLATGEVGSLIEVSPRMVQQFAIQAHHVLLEAKAATNLGAITPASDRVVLDPIMRIARAKKWLPWQSGLVRAAVIGGLWTGSLQKESGHKVDGICPLCLLADDTPFHRFFLCEACGIERGLVVDQSFLARALSAGPGSIKFERGILMHPGSDWPSPRGDEGTVFPIEGETSHEARHMEGDIYVDGACYPNLVPDLCRAGWAVVQRPGLGLPCKVLYGPVWPPLPQTSQCRMGRLGCCPSGGYIVGCRA